MKNDNLIFSEAKINQSKPGKLIFFLIKLIFIDQTNTIVIQKISQYLVHSNMTKSSFGKKLSRLILIETFCQYGQQYQLKKISIFVNNKLLFNQLNYKFTLQSDGFRVQFIKENQFIWIPSNQDINRVYVFEQND
ncbi:unnamed protein product [Paramecium pentaurelia]|uniref:Uncharacterized protein n=1 Tax=Paramecium pentaurelia TaxID=43138 RepID=A0A8S1XMS4_9CILI|nr:unnamed protein product [Paramecium pentaurelia]